MTLIEIVALLIGVFLLAKYREWVSETTPDGE